MSLKMEHINPISGTFKLFHPIIQRVDISGGPLTGNHPVSADASDDRPMSCYAEATEELERIYASVYHKFDLLKESEAPLTWPPWCDETVHPADGGSVFGDLAANDPVPAGSYPKWGLGFSEPTAAATPFIDPKLVRGYGDPVINWTFEEDPYYSPLMLEAGNQYVQSGGASPRPPPTAWQKLRVKVKSALPAAWEFGTLVLPAYITHELDNHTTFLSHPTTLVVIQSACAGAIGLGEAFGGRTFGVPEILMSTSIPISFTLYEKEPTYTFCGIASCLVMVCIKRMLNMRRRNRNKLHSSGAGMV